VRLEQEQWALNPCYQPAASILNGVASHKAGRVEEVERAEGGHSVAFASGQTANPRASDVIVTAQEPASRRAASVRHAQYCC